MSLIFTPRASSSRILPPSHTLAILNSRRHASNASSDKKVKKSSPSAQTAEEELAMMKRREASMKTNSANMDMLSLVTPLAERIVEPPFNPSWIFRKGFWQYMFQRIRRFQTTRQSINSMVSTGAVESRKGGSWAMNTLYMFTNRKPSNRVRPFLDEMEDLYVEYNQAQAAGDMQALRYLSTDEALKTAQNLPRANRQMKWSLLKFNSPPKLMSARMAVVDLSGKNQVFQVVVKFDSEQELTISSRGKSETKRSRVIEHYAFERLVPVRGPWKIKKRVETTPPPIGDQYEKS